MNVHGDAKIYIQQRSATTVAKQWAATKIEWMLVVGCKINATFGVDAAGEITGCACGIHIGREK
jgi:hypothetical protein